MTLRGDLLGQIERELPFNVTTDIMTDLRLHTRLTSITGYCAVCRVNIRFNACNQTLWVAM